ncbi:MAG: FecR domain-containing protein, partial [Cellvibrionaceae bacterium]|nr:FecR domain-containing protein [Cellvibrionaceae bacterium]
MSKIETIHKHRLIEETAALWLVKLDDRPLSDEEKAELGQWLENHKHRDVFLALAKLWGQLDSLGQLAEFAPLTNHKQASSPTWQLAGMALCLVLGLAFMLYQPSDGDYQQLASTNIGEIQQLQLPDGSRVNINTNTVLEVRYQNHERAIYLNRGEANFSVAHETERPFVVYVGQQRVVALGTRFNIRHGAGHSELIVTEGRVAVEAATASADSPARQQVAAGQQLRLGQLSNPVIEAPAARTEQRLAWQRGMLAFNGQALAEAVAEINRYSAKRIIINDPE